MMIQTEPTRSPRSCRFHTKDPTSKYGLAISRGTSTFGSRGVCWPQVALGDIPVGQFLWHHRSNWMAKRRWTPLLYDPSFSTAGLGRYFDWSCSSNRHSNYDVIESSPSSTSWGSSGVPPAGCGCVGGLFSKHPAEIPGCVEHLSRTFAQKISLQSQIYWGFTRSGKSSLANAI